jgi:hypothetical protein
MMRRWLPLLALFTALSVPAPAQCVMCYRSAHAQNQARARVLNLGILLLGAPPFLILAGFIAFVFSKDKVGQAGGGNESTPDHAMPLAEHFER